MEIYQHSGKAPLVSVLLSVAAGLIVALVGAFLYAWSVQWIPLIFLNFLATVFYAAIVGWAVGGVARAGKVRSLTAVGLASLLCMAAGVWLYWGASIWAMGGREVGWNAWRPDVLWAFVEHLYVNGSWGIKNGNPVTGLFLAAVWVVEIGMLLGIAWVTALACVGQPFCESCGQWTQTEKRVAAFDAEGHEPVWQRVITDDLPALGEVPLLVEDKAKYVRLDFAKCPNCENSNFMTLQAVHITTDNKGNVETIERKLIEHGVLTAEQSQIIRHLAAMAIEEVQIDPAAEAPPAVSESDPSADQQA